MKVRAETKDGKEVVGYYYYSRGMHYVLTELPGLYWDDFGSINLSLGSIHEIYPATAAIDTRYKDAHEKPIFGTRFNMAPGVDFAGGDILLGLISKHRYIVVWYRGGWSALDETTHRYLPLGELGTTGFEIINDKATSTAAEPN